MHLYLDILLAIALTAAAVASAGSVLWSFCHRRQLSADRTVRRSLLGTVIGGGTVGVAAAALIDPWPDVVISAPVGLFLGSVIGLPAALLSGALCGFACDRVCRSPQTGDEKPDVSAVETLDRPTPPA